MYIYQYELAGFKRDSRESLRKRSERRSAAFGKRMDEEAITFFTPLLAFGVTLGYTCTHAI